MLYKLSIRLPRVDRELKFARSLAPSLILFQHSSLRTRHSARHTRTRHRHPTRVYIDLHLVSPSTMASLASVRAQLFDIAQRLLTASTDGAGDAPDVKEEIKDLLEVLALYQTVRLHLPTRVNNL